MLESEPPCQAVEQSRSTRGGCQGHSVTSNPLIVIDLLLLGALYPQHSRGRTLKLEGQNHRV